MVKMIGVPDEVDEHASEVGPIVTYSTGSNLGLPRSHSDSKATVSCRFSSKLTFRLVQERHRVRLQRLKYCFSSLVWWNFQVHRRRGDAACWVT